METSPERKLCRHQGVSRDTSPGTRRFFLKRMAGLFSAISIGQFLSGLALAQTKKSPQKLVKYQPTPKLNRKCADCTFFLGKEKACKVVEGTIDPNGWCLRWAKKSA